MKYAPHIAKWIAILLLAVITSCLVLGLSSCSIMRKVDKTETKKDSVAVSSIDSNWLKKIIEQNNNTKSTGQEIRIYQPRDTNIYKNTYPTYNTYPQTDNSGLLAVLTNWQHESTQQQKTTLDSGHLAAKDSTKATLQESEKQTETKAGTPWYIYAFAAALAFLLLKGFIPKFKIVKA
jgi:hypothetical protein